jgi:putative sigma-54 modulation protein
MLNVSIFAKNFPLTDGLRFHTLRRLELALSYAQHDVREIYVRLSDVNGPKGGEDKRCQLQVRLSNDADVTVDGVEIDMYLAIDRAIACSKRAVSRKVQRKRAQYAPRNVQHSQLAGMTPEAYSQ